MDIMEALLWLCLNIYHEARSDDRLGQLAVAHVTLNRAELRGLTVREVVLQPAQFSWVDKVDIMPKEHNTMLEIANVAKTAFSGKDITGGATHYHHVSIQPHWADKMEYITTFGSHKFYKKYKVKVLTAGNFKSKPNKARRKS
jgi:N-acetylmuramoyl-L-alanine amidase